LSHDVDIKYSKWIMMLILNIDLNSWFDSSRYNLLLLTCWIIMQQNNAINLITSSWFMRILTIIDRDFLMSINHDSWKYWLLLIEIFSWILIMTHENIDYNW